MQKCLSLAAGPVPCSRSCPLQPVPCGNQAAIAIAVIVFERAVTTHPPLSGGIGLPFKPDVEW